MAISQIESGGTLYPINAAALDTPASIDGIAFDGGDSVTHYAVCSTAAGTAAKVAAAANEFTLATGSTVSIKFIYGNTAANPTLNVSSTGAIPIITSGTAGAGNGAWAAGECLDLRYDGTNWLIVSGAIASTSVAGRVKLDSAPTSGSNNAPTSGSVYAALATKQNKLTFDATPTDGSTNPVTSNGVYDADAQIRSDYGDPDTIARTDGSYDSMTVGNAEQLISTISTEDSVPYAFRTSGGAADIGDREQDIVVGGSVVWNQLMQNGNFESTSGWAAQNGSLTVANNVCTLAPYGQSSAPKTASTIRHYIEGAAIANHVYMAFGTIKPAATTSRLTIRLYNGTAQTYIKQRDYTGSFTANVSLTISVIGKTDVDITNGYFRFYIGGNAEGGSYDVTNINVFDLTAMFGTAIADYIYSVEQATAGAGVALAKRWGNIIKPYYPYSAGGLISVSGLVSHDMVGFNQYDHTSGTAKVIGGQQYRITGTYTGLSLDGTAVTPDASGLFTPAVNGTLTVTGGGSDTCIHFVHDGSRNGEYEPYEKHSYSLDSSLTLHGIPKLNAANELYYDGDRYLPDGTVERRYAELTGQSGAVGDAISLTGVAPNTTDIVTSAGHLADVGTLSGDTLTLTVALSNASIVYPLAEPATESATPYAENQYVSDWGTEEYVSTATDYVIPVGHETKYPSNLRDKLQHLPSLSANGDGTYAIQQTGSQMSLVHLPAVLPALSGENGSYVLKATVTSGTATLSWVAE